MPCLQIRGLIAAPHTPFLSDGSLNLPVIDKQVQLLLEGRTSGAFVCGTTGESSSLSTSERMQVAARWIEAAPKSFPVIVHVGHTSIVESCALAAHAQACGASAIAALAPYYFKPANVSDLVKFCVQVAAAAPAIPFYFYNIPGMTGVSLSMVEFIGQARERIPTFAGLKYTHNDLAEFQKCLQLAEGSLDMFFGRDEILMAGLLAGAKVAVGSTYNYAAPVYLRIIEAMKAGDFAAAREHQSKAGRMIGVLRKYGEIPTAKAITSMMGVPCGPARTPLPKLTEAQTRNIFDELQGLDVFTRPLRPG